MNYKLIKDNDKYVEEIGSDDSTRKFIPKTNADYLKWSKIKGNKAEPAE